MGGGEIGIGCVIKPPMFGLPVATAEVSPAGGAVVLATLGGGFGGGGRAQRRRTNVRWWASRFLRLEEQR